MGNINKEERSNYFSRTLHHFQTDYLLDITSSLVVSGVKDCTFYMREINEKEGHNIRRGYKNDVIVVDLMLLLGEVKGNNNLNAEFRIIPLREGTLNIPLIKLYDSLGKKWYSPEHLLQISVTKNQVP